ncbi:acetyltransferase [Vibrio alginolyticus]|uniref:acetyltransferase n=1 Tax=Vibrio TaxID=662 RepID=UPI0006CA6302|nr:MULTISPECIES: acetyltransferase [Vibrio]EIO9264165.1 acetyltransferase [Vibrio alginolyticus]ELA7831126.1 acetyltransferase [Vibrio alginolyticus]ELB2831451.1 acetyltransferase [Vibrio alginolyticus]ELB2835459.1 acetyltransferase [Vibrio alginolyticus]ELB2908439.1 acetyltransferase [Vibrio alginolyticus]
MSDEVNLPIVMIGGGGHASVLAEILLTQGRDILAVISPEDVSQRSVFKGISILEKDKDILRFDKDKILLVNGIGMMPKSGFKKKINEYFLSLGYHFETVIADSAFVSPFSKIEIGAQILPMAMIQTGATVGSHSIINTGALVEHDCKIGAYNHIAPKATLCGQVETKESVYVGAGSTVTQGISIGSGAIVGAGASLTKSLEENTIAYPARAVIKTNS